MIAPWTQRLRATPKKQGHRQATHQPETTTQSHNPKTKAANLNPSYKSRSYVPGLTLYLLPKPPLPTVFTAFAFFTFTTRIRQKLTCTTAPIHLSNTHLLHLSTRRFDLVPRQLLPHGHDRSPLHGSLWGLARDGLDVGLSLSISW